MCGRYYVDDDTMDEVERVMEQASGGLYVQNREKLQLIPKDILPSDEALVLKATRQGIICCLQKWGIPGFQQGQLLINARSETVTDKRIFKEGILRRRIVIPAAGFYEWNANKEKNIFTRKDRRAVFMAGFSDKGEDGDRFVILTTAANASMKAVHDRMPVILEEQDIPTWLLDEARMGALMRKVSCELERKTDYEQLSLF